MKSFKLQVLVFLFLSCCQDISLSAQVIIGRSNTNSFNITPGVINPPILNIERSSIKFRDDNNNNVLDPYEEAEISFRIDNSGEGPARDIKFSVLEKNFIGGLIFGRNQTIGIIEGKSSKTTLFYFSANEQLEDGIAKFSIEFNELNGFIPNPIEITVNTRRFLAPKVNLVDFKLQSAQNIIKQGTPFELLFLIQNTGEGEAQNVNIKIDTPENTFIVKGEKQYIIGAMGPGDTALLKYSFIANSRYTSTEIPLSITLSEKFGKYGENKNISLPINQDYLVEDLVITSGEEKEIEFRSTVQIARLGIDIEIEIPESDKLKNNVYVLAIGNEDYTTYQPELTNEANVNFAVSDATIFSKYCEKTFGIPKENITLITNAISSQMKREIIRLTDKSKYLGTDIELIFYYSGHGFPDESKESYIMPVDISGTNVTQGIKLSELYVDLTRNPCKKVTVIIDACFSGGGRNLGLLTAKAVRIVPKEIAPKGNLVVFAASSGYEESLLYKEKQHGLFTYFFIKKLQETKGEATFGELHDYLQKMVPITASDIYYKTQTPQTLYSQEIADVWRWWKF